VSLLRNAESRRFALLLNLSVLWKVAAVAVFLVLVVHLTAGGSP
jgi:hypothetical protein